MKKVMFMTNSLAGGGAEKVLQTLLKNLDYEKYDVTLYSMHPETIEDIDYPVPIHYKAVFDRYKGNNPFLRLISDIYGKVKGKLFNTVPPRFFYRLYFHEKYAVEIAFIEGESTKIISGSTNRRSKKYAWVHIDLEKNPWTSFLYKDVQEEVACYRKFDRILCVSNAVKEAFLEKYQVNAVNVCVQYNPIDRDEIIKKSCLMCSAVSKRHLRMIAVGRLVAQKGFDRLLNAAFKLKEDGFDFEILILGEGELRGELEIQIRSLKIEDTVKLLGFQKNPYAIMATGDILVCSSRAEGFSTVVTEGLVLGLPVISTDCAGIREAFGEKACGIITENNTDSLYAGLKEVLSCPEKLDFFKKEAQKRGQFFSLTNTMKEINQLLED